MSRATFQRLFAVCLTALVAAPPPLLACSVCQGEAGAPMSDALRWSVLLLLGVVLAVLAGIASFFIYLVKRSATASTPLAAGGASAAANHP